MNTKLKKFLKGLLFILPVVTVLGVGSYYYFSNKSKEKSSHDSSKDSQQEEDRYIENITNLPDLNIDKELMSEKSWEITDSPIAKEEQPFGVENKETTYYEKTTKIKKGPVTINITAIVDPSFNGFVYSTNKKYKMLGDSIGRYKAFANAWRYSDKMNTIDSSYCQDNLSTYTEDMNSESLICSKAKTFQTKITIPDKAETYIGYLTIIVETTEEDISENILKEADEFILNMDY